MPEPAEVRVSDEQRERAVAEIREHYAAGRLDSEEFDERVQAAYRARTERELSALHADLPLLPVTAAQERAELLRRRGELQRRVLQQSGGTLVPFALCTAIWAISGASGFFWPVFVLLFALIPLVRNAWRLYGPAPELERVERELAWREGRNRTRHTHHHAANRRAERYERRHRRRTL
jgi:hypothetical protein